MDTRRTLEEFDAYVESNSLHSDSMLEAAALTQAMVGIGMQFASDRRQHNPNIERTLFNASRVAMDADDFRVLGVLVLWLELHHFAVNVRALQQLLETASPRVLALWSSVSRWPHVGRRWRELSVRPAFNRANLRARIDLLPTGTDFLIKRHGGEDPRFIDSPLRVPTGVLRTRLSDVLTPEALATIHQAYRWRVIVGPVHRADAWAALEGDPTLNVSELSQLACCSRATAARVLRERAILQNASIALEFRSK